MIFTSFLNASFKKCHNSWSYLKYQEKKIRIQGKTEIGTKTKYITTQTKLCNLSQKDRIIVFITANTNFTFKLIEVVQFSVQKSVKKARV